MKERRRAVARAGALLVIVAGASVAPATVATALGKRCPAGAEDAVIAAYANVFSRATQLSTDERAASLAGSDRPAVRALLDAWLASPIGASTTVTVNDVRCRSANRAEVDADLVLAGTALAEVLPPGRAVRRDGAWKVATATFCTRMILEDPALADAGVCAR